MTDSPQNPETPPQPNPDERQLNLQLSVGMTNQILSIVSEKPAKDVFRIITTIQNQASAQLQPRILPAEAEEPEAVTTDP